MNGPLPIRDAMSDPAALQRIEEIVTAFRAALAPAMWQAGENLPQMQADIITASGMMAGMTIGHMKACGALSAKDVERAKKLAFKNVQSGIEIGLKEARAAILAQSKPEGTS